MAHSMFYLEHPIRFKCTGCGKCCTGNKDAYVEVSAKEQRKIQTFLDISPAWFRRRYLSRFDDGDIAVAMDTQGRCPFLDKEDRCRIYPVRPMQCRTYPYWDEVLRSRSSWNHEAKYCEGIHRGPVVAVSKIKAELKRNKSG